MLSTENMQKLAKFSVFFGMIFRFESFEPVASKAIRADKVERYWSIDGFTVKQFELADGIRRVGQVTAGDWFVIAWTSSFVATRPLIVLDQRK